MGYFAELDANNVVTAVIAVSDGELGWHVFPVSEAYGVRFLTSTYGAKTWKQTSRDGSFRKNSAGRGYTYDAALDAFIPKKPFVSWTLNTSTCRWEAPVPYPTDGKMYRWDEASLSWVRMG